MPNVLDIRLSSASTNALRAALGTIVPLTGPRLRLHSMTLILPTGSDADMPEAADGESASQIVEDFTQQDVLEIVERLRRLRVVHLDVERVFAFLNRRTNQNPSWRREDWRSIIGEAWFAEDGDGMRGMETWRIGAGMIYVGNADLCAHGRHLRHISGGCRSATDMIEGGEVELEGIEEVTVELETDCRRDGFELFGRWVQRASLPHMKALRLNLIGIHEGVPTDYPAGLLGSIPFDRFAALRAIEINTHHVGMAWEDIESVLEASALERLKVDGQKAFVDGFGDAQMLRLARSLTNLKALDLNFYSDITDQSLGHLNMYCRQLTALRVLIE